MASNAFAFAEKFAQDLDFGFGAEALAFAGLTGGGGFGFLGYEDIRPTG